MNITEIRILNLNEILKDRFGGNQTRLAEAVGKAQPYISGVLDAKRPFTEKLAQHIVEKLNLPAGYLDRDHESKEDQTIIQSVIMAPVKLKEFKVCAGPGLEAVIEETREIIGIPWKILKSYGLKPEQVFAAEVDGASMVPTYNSEDYIFVATTPSMREIKNYEPYLVKYDFELMVKRLEKIGNTVTMKSDNQDKNRYPDRIVQDGIDFDIVGRIIAKIGT